MYGGHITDDWDRRLCRTYLAEYIRTEMLEGEVLLAPGFQIPPNLDYKGYHEYIDENLPPESPYLYGLHPNAEIGFLTVTSEKLFRTVLEMQPKETDSGAGTGVSREEKAGPPARSSQHTGGSGSGGRITEHRAWALASQPHCPALASATRNQQGEKELQAGHQDPGVPGLDRSSFSVWAQAVLQREAGE